MTEFVIKGCLDMLPEAQSIPLKIFLSILYITPFTFYFQIVKRTYYMTIVHYLQFSSTNWRVFRVASTKKLSDAVLP
jgi:hypothetical protein